MTRISDEHYAERSGIDMTASERARSLLLHHSAEFAREWARGCRALARLHGHIGGRLYWADVLDEMEAAWTD